MLTCVTSISGKIAPSSTTIPTSLQRSSTGSSLLANAPCRWAKRTTFYRALVRKTFNGRLKLVQSMEANKKPPGHRNAAVCPLKITTKPLGQECGTAGHDWLNRPVTPCLCPDPCHPPSDAFDGSLMNLAAWACGKK